MFGCDLVYCCFVVFRGFNVSCGLVLHRKLCVFVLWCFVDLLVILFWVGHLDVCVFSFPLVDFGYPVCLVWFECPVCFSILGISYVFWCFGTSYSFWCFVCFLYIFAFCVFAGRICWFGLFLGILVFVCFLCWCWWALCGCFPAGLCKLVLYVELCSLLRFWFCVVDCAFGFGCLWVILFWF